MSPIELEPCPFCGGEAELITRGNAFTKKRSAEVKCKTCTAIVICGAVKLGMDFCVKTVTKQWNTRALAKSQPEVVSEQDIENVKKYISIMGPACDEDCPMDDTCNCSGKPLHDSLTKVIDAAKFAPVKPPFNRSQIAFELGQIYGMKKNVHMVVDVELMGDIADMFMAKFAPVKSVAMPTGHAGDCTIYRSMANKCITAGVCTCGFGWEQHREGHHNDLFSAERLKAGIEFAPVKPEGRMDYHLLYELANEAETMFPDRSSAALICFINKIKAKFNAPATGKEPEQSDVEELENIMQKAREEYWHTEPTDYSAFTYIATAILKAGYRREGK